MITSWHTFASQADYQTHRYDDISQQEGLREFMYFDTATPPKPTIGIGFNLRDDAVRTAVLQAMEIDVNLIPTANSAARAAEQGYIDQLRALLKPSSGLYPTLVILQVALDDILIQRSLDPLLSGFAHIASRVVFSMQPQEIQTAFTAIIPNYEDQVDAWLPGIPQSNERLALVSLAYNSPSGSNNLLGDKLRQAILADNRAEAWYEIRYRSNGDGGHTDRRIDESNLFSLYNNPGQGVGETEAKDVLRMYTTHRIEILDYENRFSTQFASSGTATIQFQLTSAITTLIANFAEGRTINGEVLVGQNDVFPGDILEGTASGDLLFGERGNDVLRGSGGTDVLYGGEGIDTLSGGTEADLLRGEAGADTLQGGTGDDRLEGGAGFDTYIYNSGDGNDRIEDSDATGVIKVNGQTLVGGIKKAGHTDWTSPDGSITYEMSGTDLVVQLNGTTILTVNEDFESGQFGIRLLDASALPDGTPPVIDYNNGYSTSVVSLSPGPVEFNGSGQYITQEGPINSVVQGNYGPEILWADNLISTSSYAQNQQVYGGAGSDQIIGDFNDRLYGEAGDDLIEGSWGSDVLSGGEGRDLIFADKTGSLQFGTYDDYLDGGSEQDALNGMAGNDTLLGGTGDDELFGDDYAGYAQRPVGNDYLNGGDGNDRLFAGLGDDTLLGGIGNDRLFGDNLPAGEDKYVWTERPWIIDENNNEWFQGYDFSVEVAASSALFSINGGKDYLEGGAGNDILQGDGGDDILFGGADNDELWGDDQQIAMVEEGDDWLDGEEGDDQLVGAGGEDSLSGGEGDDELVGDYLGNTTLGFNDILDGGAGIDHLYGGGGADLLDGGTEADVLSGEHGDDHLYGGAGDDELQGGEGNDSLAGEAGVDLLFGGIGDDALFGDEDNDQLSGGEGLDDLSGGTGNDILLGDEGDDTLLGDEGNDQLQGGDGNDGLIGDAGNDALFGEADDDLLWGDEGADQLTGGPVTTSRTVEPAATSMSSISATGRTTSLKRILSVM